MKTPIISLASTAAILFLATLYTASAAPTPFPAPVSGPDNLSNIAISISPRSDMNYSPASARRPPPHDKCISSGSDPICNPANYNQVTSYGNDGNRESNRGNNISGSSTNGRSHDEGLRRRRSLTGERRQNQWGSAEEEMEEKEYVEDGQSAGAEGRIHGDDTYERKHEEEDGEEAEQDPRVTISTATAHSYNVQKRYISRSSGIGSTYAKEWAQGR